MRMDMTHSHSPARPLSWLSHLGDAYFQEMDTIINRFGEQ